MNYQIHIKDRLNIEDELILHYAERFSINLDWEGSDDELNPIVGSFLNFTIENNEGSDGKYDYLYTTDEKRWLVQLYLVEANENITLLWSGFLLPETYQEPWNAKLFYIEFQAVDGLGLLRGKTLPASFFEGEKTVLEIILECLSYTQIDYEVFFTPAVKHITKNWDETYTQLSFITEEEKTPSVYEVLETLLEDMLCVLYQADQRWFIEGVNKRGFVEQEYRVYNLETKQFSRLETYRKNIKKVTWLPNPTINIEAPYKEVIVRHQASELKFPEGTAEITDLPFTISSFGINPFYFNENWDWADHYETNEQLGLSPKFAPEMLPAERNMMLLRYTLTSNEFDEDIKIELRNKPFVLKGMFLRFEMDLEVFDFKNLDVSENDIEAWSNLFVFRISINETTYFYNLLASINEPNNVVFDSSGKCSLNFSFEVKEDGFLNLELFEPYGDVTQTKFAGVIVTKLQIEDRNQQDEKVFRVEIEEEASQVLDKELTFSDDITLNSPSFYTDLVLQLQSTGKLLVIQPLNTFVVAQQRYWALNLRDAVLLNQFKNQEVEYFTVNNLVLLFPEVIFNFLGSDMHVIKVPMLGGDYKFRLDYRKLANSSNPRSNWQLWADDYFKVERDRYGQAVANVINRMYMKERLNIEGVSDVPCKFNDIIMFTYKDRDVFFAIKDCSWGVNDGNTSLNVSEINYFGSSFGNIPPFINFETPRLLEVADTELEVTDVVAFDPDGEIDESTILWQLESGDSNAVITNPNQLNTSFTNLTGNSYTFSLLLADNSGLFSTKELQIIRKKEYSLFFSETQNNDRSEGGKDITDRKFKIGVLPSLAPRESLNVSFTFKFEQNNVLREEFNDRAFFSIARNGLTLFFYQLNEQAIKNADVELLIPNEIIGLLPTEELEFSLFMESTNSFGPFPPPFTITTTTIEINEVEAVGFFGSVDTSISPITYSTL